MGRSVVAVWLSWSLLYATSCRAKHESTGLPPAPASAAAAIAQASNAGPVPSVEPPVAPEVAALASALERWNRATNTADAGALEAVYAKELNFYQQVISRTAAVKRKLEYIAKHPGFSQTLDKPSFRHAGDRWTAKFRKTSISQGSAASSVDAYLVFRQAGDGWQIVDEGDVQTTLKMRARQDTLAKNWGERFWDCPHCKDDPDFTDDPPQAFPPLGPASAQATPPIAEGAPQTIEYARALFPRFASAVDVPLFLKATAQSGNGDGRWFYYDAPTAAARPSLTSGEPKHLLECAIGGHFWDVIPRHAKPDPGHGGEPVLKYTEKFERRTDEITYERYIYATDRVMNYVLCTFDPKYEAFFSAIVRRMGRSMRAISGGQIDRVARESQPYGAE